MGGGREGRGAGQEALREAAGAARRSRARMLAALRWVERLGGLSAEARGRWDVALARYRRERALLDEEAARDWTLSRGRLAEVLRARREAHGKLREALDGALAALAALATLAESGARPGREGEVAGEGGEGGEGGDGEARLGAPATPEEGEVLLVYHPVRAGWVGFAVTAGEVRARRLGEVDSGAPEAQLAAQLLAPFGDLLQRSRRLRVAAFGALERVDVHALPWEGEPVVARWPVVYGLDLREGGLRVAGGAVRASRRAILVADPRGDLPAARREARAVRAALEGRGAGWQAAYLEGAAATHRAVRDALDVEGATLFHYAGHGVFAGRDGWESGLPLAEGGWLTLGDIMALPRVPERVILSGCETGRSGEEPTSGGLGLAQAFAVGGALEILAAVRPVEDALAERMMTGVHEAMGVDPALGLPEALRAAQLAVVREGNKVDWQSFRAIVP
ncbi:Tetratricopeptide TPR_4 [Chondromyces apiculatus DSM 436]|uniref:Tetratricopeptide TPR_4 n=1 Tax=Chondromyces apiculatus DSM 436 TaxID=1192034 RepID=A0A017T1K2_9BACT|nr:Tetratricopeptide TPR_4 [Chondromyces apiculatus DSM 436]